MKKDPDFDPLGVGVELFSKLFEAAVLDHSFVTANLSQILDFRRGKSNMDHITGQADIRSFLNFIEIP
jgi:hypothetical protein